MKKSKLLILIVLIACGALLQSCSLKSTTYIKANERFLLGDNAHRVFWVRLKNVSSAKGDIEIYRAPIGGGRHSGQTVKAGESVLVKVESNTALVVQNNTSDEAAVKLSVRGDTQLSMGYKRQETKPAD